MSLAKMQIRKYELNDRFNSRRQYMLQLCYTIF